MSPTLKQSCFLLMAFASTTLVAADWTYDASAKTITDGVWTIPVSADGKNLTLDANATAPSNPSDLDFTKGVKDSGGVSYTIVSVVASAFNGKMDKVSAIRIGEGFVAINGYSFGQDDGKSAVTSIVVNSSALLTAGDNAFRKATKCEAVVFKAPSLKHVGASLFYGLGTAVAVGASADFDFSAAETFGNAAFGSMKLNDGVVRLPSFKTMSGTGKNLFHSSTGIRVVEFGSDGISPDFVFQGTFYNATANGGVANAVIGTTPYNASLSVEPANGSTGCFNANASTWFRGAPPKFGMNDTVVFVGQSTLDPRKTKFVIAENQGGWGEIVMKASRRNRQVEDAEEGVVGYLTYKDFGGTSTEKFGVLAYGDVSALLGGWTLSDDKATMSDGIWTLNVTVTEATRSVKVTGAAVAQTRPQNLDFSKPIRDDAGDVWHLTEIAGSAFYLNGNASTGKDVQMIRALNLACPELKTIGDNAFGNQNNASAISSITIRAPKLTSIGASAFRNAQNVSKFVVSAPEVATIGGSAFMNVASGQSSPIAANLSFPKATTFGNAALGSMNVTGSVRLPDFRSPSGSSGIRNFLYADAGITDVEFGGMNMTSSIKLQGVFSGMSDLKNVVLGDSADEKQVIYSKGNASGQYTFKYSVSYAFRGKPPKFDESTGSGSLWGGTKAVAQTRFVALDETADGWSTVKAAAQARPLSDGEREGYDAFYADGLVPVGKLALSDFGLAGNDVEFAVLVIAEPADVLGTLEIVDNGVVTSTEMLVTKFAAKAGGVEGLTTSGYKLEKKTAAGWTTVLENFADDSLDFSGEGVSPKDELRLTWRYVDLSKKGLCLIFR